MAIKEAIVWCNNPGDIFGLSIFVMSDFIPSNKVDAAYLYANTPDNEISILEGGLALYKSGLINTLCLAGGGPYLPPNLHNAKVAYSGYDPWRNWLENHGVESENIHAIPRPLLSHTGTEAYQFVRFAKSHNWKKVCVVACPTHMLRAFVNTVACALREYPELLIYAKPGTSLAWDEKVLSSQGNVFGTRSDTVMKSEWDRLNTVWHDKYDVVGSDKIVEYIKWRNAQNRRSRKSQRSRSAK